MLYYGEGVCIHSYTCSRVLPIRVTGTPLPWLHYRLRVTSDRVQPSTAAPITSDN